MLSSLSRFLSFSMPSTFVFITDFLSLWPTVVYLFLALFNLCLSVIAFVTEMLFYMKLMNEAMGLTAVAREKARIGSDPVLDVRRPCPSLHQVIQGPTTTCLLSFTQGKKDFVFRFIPI